jgi:hypothetical protein
MSHQVNQERYSIRGYVDRGAIGFLEEPPRDSQLGTISQDEGFGGSARSIHQELQAVDLDCSTQSVFA